MPSAPADNLSYERPPATAEQLDYADLASIDLSKWPEKKAELLEDIQHAVHEVGFWVVVNSGITDEEVLRQLAIGEAFLDQPIEEKRKYPCRFGEGKYVRASRDSGDVRDLDSTPDVSDFFGFREATRLMGETAVKDNAEALNLPKITPVLAHELPPFDFILAHKDEIAAFQHKVHQNVLTPLLSLFALLLELPEDYFTATHAWERATEDHLRYMRYTPNTKEDDEAIGGVHVHGHTDFGLVTLLFAQIVQGLQLRDNTNTWKYVPYIPNSIVVNTADVLSFLSGGWIKSTIHRVVRPPDDQAQFKRLGLFYFSRAANNIDIVVAPSPLLKRLGLYPKEQPEKPLKGIEFTRARVKHNWDRPRYGDAEYLKGFSVGNLTVKTNYE